LLAYLPRGREGPVFQAAANGKTGEIGRCSAYGSAIILLSAAGRTV